MVEPLHKTESEYTFDEYKKLNEEVMDEINKMPLLIFLSMTIIAFIGLFGNGGFYIYAIITLLVPVLFRVLITQKIKKTYSTNKLIQGTKFHVEFYQKYLEQKSTAGNLKVPYDQIYRILETNSNFYIMTSCNQGIIIIKSNCSPELIDFLIGTSQRYM